MLLSVVIPAYNEAKRLGPTLDKVHAYLQTKGYGYEVIVVDDGSTDNTKEAALKNQLNESGKLILLGNERNRGKGYSVKKGILASRGEYVLFSDADLSTPIEELDKLFLFMSEADIVIGSRAVTGANIHIHQPWHREFMGRLFNLSVRLMLLPGIRDTQCGFKLLKSNSAKQLASSMKINGFVFDVELLYLANKLGYAVREIPVVWNNSNGSSVSLLRHFPQVCKDLLSIKRIHNAR